MNIIKKTTISLFFAAITVLILCGGYSLAADEKYDFESGSYFVTTKNSYHGEMNDFFKSKMKKIVESLDKDPNGKDENLYAPDCDIMNVENPNECREKCTPENLSAYCVAVESTDIYFKYIVKLDALSKQVFYPAGDTHIDADDVLRSSYLRNDAIKEEIPSAKRHLEATISAYNEFRTAYAMHMQYETVIDNLIRYKNSLRSVYREVRKFPTNFIDVTSTKCE